MRGRSAGAVIGLASLLICLTEAAGADTFRVTQTFDRAGSCDARCALREAVIAANNNGETDRLRLPAGRYELNIGGPGEDSAAEGDLDIREPGSKMILIGAGMGETVIDANRIDRVFDLVGFAGVNLVLKDLTVTGGKAKQSYEGAGLKVPGGTIAKLLRTRVSGNTTASDTSYDGAGIDVDGDATLKRSVVSNNLTRTGDGGGIENGGDLTLVDTTVTENRALEGDGGGISMNGATSLFLDSSTISANSAGGPDLGGDGGGIYAPGSGTTSTLVNSTLSGNVARGDSSQGGGIYVRGMMALTNTTVALNDSKADEAGGIFTVTGADVDLLNTIVAENEGSGGEQNCAGTAPVDSLGNNLEDRNTCHLGAPDDLPRADARLGRLADNTGPTRTHALLAGSDAVNAANTIGCPPRDQRNVPRPQGPRCDIGSFERVS